MSHTNSNPSPPRAHDGHGIAQAAKGKKENLLRSEESEAKSPASLMGAMVRCFGSRGPPKGRENTQNYKHKGHPPSKNQESGCGSNCGTLVALVNIPGQINAQPNSQGTGRRLMLPMEALSGLPSCLVAKALLSFADLPRLDL